MYRSMANTLHHYNIISKSGSPVAGQQQNSASTSPAAPPATRVHPNGKSSKDIGTSDNDEEQKHHQQLFKQRSIRATLAPNMQSQPKNSTSKPLIDSHQHQNDQHRGSSTSDAPLSLKSAASSQQNYTDNPNDIVKRHSIHSDASVSGSSSSSSDATINNNNVKLPSKSSPSNNHHQHALKASNSQPSSRSSRAVKDMQPELADANYKVGTKTTSHHHQHHRSQNTTSNLPARSSPEQVATNESYVSVLNHCFDDIEKFILRLQQSVTAHRELQAKKKLARRAANQSSHSSSTRNHSGSTTSSATLAMSSSASNGSSSTSTTAAVTNSNNNGVIPVVTNVELSVLMAKARGPNEEDYFEILSKFKLAFNLLAKLKGCIHDPNAPELVHFLFTPLTIIIESARNASPQIDPTLVGIPYLNQDALDLLSNCCTSKESDMWLSLGPNWTQTIDLNLLKVSRLPSSFQPVFSDGWAPVIGELELIGLVLPPNVMQPPQQASLSITSSSSSSSSPNKMSKHHTKLQQQTSPTNDGKKLDNGPRLSSKSRSQHYLNNPNVNSMQNGGALRRRNGSTPQINDPIAQAALATPLRSDYHQRQAPLDAYNDPYEDHYRASHYRSGTSADESVPQARVVKSQSSSSRSAAPRSYQKPLVHHTDLIEPFIHDDNAFEPMNEYSHEPIDSGNFAGGRNNMALLDQQYKNDRMGSKSRPSYLTDGLDYNAIELDDSLLPPPFAMRPPMVDHMQATANNYRHTGHHRQSGDVLLSPAYLVRRYTQTDGLQQEQLDHKRYPAQHRRQSAGAPRDLYSDEPLNGVNANGGYLDEADQEAMLLDLGPAQTEWFFELQSRGAMIVRVLFTREANNDKELTVRRGELLEILDNSRRWWRARNIEMEIAFVPHTIVAPMQNYQSLDELLISNCEIADLPDQTGFLQSDQQQQQQHNHQKSRHANLYLNQASSQLNHQQHSQSRQQAIIANVRQPPQHQQQLVRNSVSGPFRYF